MKVWIVRIIAQTLNFQAVLQVKGVNMLLSRLRMVGESHCSEPKVPEAVLKARHALDILCVNNSSM